MADYIFNAGRIGNWGLFALLFANVFINKEPLPEIMFWPAWLLFVGMMLIGTFLTPLEPRRR